jgi:hypothetical protein
VVVQRLDALRTEALDLHEVGKLRRDARGDLVEWRQVAGGDKAADARGDIAADVRVFGEVRVRLDEVGDALREARDRLRGIAPGAYAEGVPAVDFEQGGQALARARDIPIVQPFRHVDLRHHDVLLPALRRGSMRAAFIMRRPCSGCDRARKNHCFVAKNPYCDGAGRVGRLITRVRCNER